MNHKKETLNRYRQKFNQFGETPEALGWMKGRQNLRFRILFEAIAGVKIGSVFDFGCGFGDFYNYLLQEGWMGRYMGVDLVSEFVDVAKSRYGDDKFLEGTIADLPNDFKVDFTVASGVFNCLDGVDDKYAFIGTNLADMVGVTRVCVALNFLSDQVEFEQAGSFHASPEVVLDLVRDICPRYTIRHDYMRFEYTVYLYLNEEAGDNHVYSK